MFKVRIELYGKLEYGYSHKSIELELDVELIPGFGYEADSNTGYNIRFNDLNE